MPLTTLASGVPPDSCQQCALFHSSRWAKSRRPLARQNVSYLAQETVQPTVVMEISNSLLAWW
jgi:hypothetical protein